MATGSTYDFEQSRDEIISDALSKLGVVGPGKDATGDVLNHGARALNAVVKSIDPDGNFLWRIVERTATTTDGTAYVDAATDVIAVDEPANYKRAAESTRTPLTAMSRDDYMAIADRTIEGRPNRFYVVKTLAQPVRIHLDPIPDATSDVVTYSAVLRSKDYDAGTNTPDFPPEWTMCLVYGLASYLAFDYAQPALAGQLRDLFLSEKARLIEAGTEHGNTMFVPFGGSY